MQHLHQVLSGCLRRAPRAAGAADLPDDGRTDERAYTQRAYTLPPSHSSCWSSGRFAVLLSVIADFMDSAVQRDDACTTHALHLATCRECVLSLMHSTTLSVQHYGPAWWMGILTLHDVISCTLACCPSSHVLLVSCSKQLILVIRGILPCDFALHLECTARDDAAASADWALDQAGKRCHRDSHRGPQAQALCSSRAHLAAQWLSPATGMALRALQWHQLPHRPEETGPMSQLWMGPRLAPLQSNGRRCGSSSRSSFPPTLRGADRVSYLQRMYLDMWAANDAQTPPPDSAQPAIKDGQTGGDDEEGEEEEDDAGAHPVVLRPAPGMKRKSASHRSTSPAASIASAKEIDLPPIEGKFSEWLLLLDDGQLSLVMDQFQMAPTWMQTPEMQVRKAEVTCLRAKRKLRQAEFEEQSATAALRIALLNQATAAGAATPGVGSQDTSAPAAAATVAAAGAAPSGQNTKEEEAEQATHADTSADAAHEQKRPVKKRRTRK